jgi:tripartite-type tricarboxylate transporter receptor subunit TctC
VIRSWCRGDRHETSPSTILASRGERRRPPDHACVASALDYPSQPVRLIVPYAPGGTTDTVARQIGPWLSERFAQAFVIESRPGAGTNVGTDAVAHAAPDGNTLLLFDPSAAINATLYDKLNFNFIRDIAPIVCIFRTPLVIVINPSFAAKTLPEFIAYAKANPGRINMASAGIGSSSQLAGELFKEMAGIDMTHIPYRGGGPAIVNLLGGQVDVFFSPMAIAVAHIRAGKLRALATTGAIRSDALPEIPTVGEFVPSFETSYWIGLGAPKNTPVDHRQAQQGNQRGPRKPRLEVALCRSGRQCGWRLGR